MSAIEWTNVTWNPTRGCTRVSPGCERCYAERQAARMSGPGGAYEGLVRTGAQGVRWTGKVRFSVETLAKPLTWRTPQRVFVDSMSDLFHDGFTNEDIASVFGVAALRPQHTFQILTKRAERLLDFLEWIERPPPSLMGGLGSRTIADFCALVATDRIVERYGEDGDLPGPIDLPTKMPWPLPNVLLGVSVETDDYVDRMVRLAQIDREWTKFVSVEPLLSEPRQLLDFLGDMDWVIVGGESGQGARPCKLEWIEAVLTRSRSAGVPCFVKQLGREPFRGVQTEDHGVVPVKMLLRNRKGGDMHEWPAHLRVRQFPSHEGGPQ